MPARLYLEERFSTGESAEIVGWIPCPTSNQIADRRCIYQIDLGRGLVPGEYLVITSQLEVTSDLHKKINPATGQLVPWNSSNVSLITGFILSDTPALIVPGSEGQGDNVGRELNEQAGENVTAGMHHGFRSPARQWDVPEGWNFPDHRYLKLIAYCSSSATVPGFQVQVMMDYGHMDATIKTPVP